MTELEVEERQRLLKHRIKAAVIVSVYQGNKVLDIHQADLRQNKMGTVLDPLDRAFRYIPWNHDVRSGIRRAEENFFLNAVRDVYRWRNAGVKHLDLNPVIFSPLTDIERDIKDARDMREHEDEYLGFSKPPQRPEKWKAKAEFDDEAYKNVIAPASATIQIGAKIMVANRVDLADTLSRCIEVANNLVTLGGFEEFRKNEPICQYPDMHWPEHIGFTKNFEDKGF